VADFDARAPPRVRVVLDVVHKDGRGSPPRSGGDSLRILRQLAPKAWRFLSDLD
jgi:hypothetical protein